MTATNNIRRIREALGLSQKHVAELIGISGPYLSQIEAGQRRLNQTQLDAAADALGVRPEDLIAQNLTDQFVQLLMKARHLDQDNQERLLGYADALLAVQEAAKPRP
jgi:transcriptional regulator with XRE-family HTH domain